MTTSSSPPPGPENKLVTQIINAAIRITPVGGSGWVLIHFLLRQDWLYAVLMFPVMLITGAWAAYTGNFITASNESAGALGKRHSQSFSSWLGQANQKLRWFFSKADDKFARCQARACQDYKAEGIAEAKWQAVPMLEEVYVPLGLRGRLGRGEFAQFAAGLSGDLSEESSEETLYIWDLLREANRTPAYKRLVIIAKGGYGKTTLLRHIAYRYGTSPGSLCRQKKVPRLIPILLYLRDWRATMGKTDAPDLPTLIAEHHLPKIKGGQKLELDRHWADKLLRQGNALVMIDGFDEVATDQCEVVSAWIDRAVATYGSSAYFMLTSRPVGYERYKNTQPWMPVEVKAFDEEQRDDFLRRWYVCQVKLSRPGRDPTHIKTVADSAADELIAQIEQRNALAEMADNPLLLCMIATFHRFRPSSELPRQRTRLYQGFCQMLLADRPESKGVPMALPAEEAQAVLQGVAWAMVQTDAIAIPKAELVALVQHLIARETDAQASPQQFIQDIEEVSELFVKRESADELEFAHRSFQEYLAAAEVRKQSCESDLLTLTEEWQGAILFYAALTNPTALINRLRARDDRKSLDLAYDCWLENPNRVPTEVFSALQEQCYSQLEQYMAEGNWKAADQYTYRLMIQVLGKAHGQGFTSTQLLTFPCADLQRIDGLWMKYSDGKFGFSVQKEIWVQCGGKLDGKYDFETYKKLGTLIGWRDEDNNWINYSELKFDLADSPLAHLPGWGGLVGVVLVLFSHPGLQHVSSKDFKKFPN